MSLQLEVCCSAYRVGLSSSQSPPYLVARAIPAAQSAKHQSPKFVSRSRPCTASLPRAAVHNIPSVLAACKCSHRHLPLYPTTARRRWELPPPRRRQPPADSDRGDPVHRLARNRRAAVQRHQADFSRARSTAYRLPGRRPAALFQRPGSTRLLLRQAPTASSPLASATSWRTPASSRCVEAARPVRRSRSS
jgi:hypothetical protein